MKTDLVLTMDEYLAQCRIATKEVSPPSSDARHVLITTKHDIEFSTKAHGCRCDRWGHLRSDCIEHKPETRTASPDSRPAK
jgi:hypothetical protein